MQQTERTLAYKMSQILSIEEMDSVSGGSGWSYSACAGGTYGPDGGDCPTVDAHFDA